MWAGIRLGAPSSWWKSRGDLVQSAVRGVYSTGGGQFSISGTSFVACWVGVEVSRGLAIQTRGIDGCTFSTGAMLAPFATQPRPWAGVQLDTVPGIQVGIPTGATARNTFTSLQHGIFCISSQTTVYNNSFKAMTAGTAPATVAPWSLYNTLYGSGSGLGNGAAIRSICPTNVTIQPSLTVGHPTLAPASSLAPYANEFNLNRYGVYTKYPQAVKVRGNKFNSDRVGVFVSYDLFRSVYVEYNTHYNDSLSIWVGNSPNSSGTLYTNTTGRIADNAITGSGGIFHGIRCDLVTYLGTPLPQYRFLILRNTLNLRGNGIWIESCKRVDVQENVITLAPLPGDKINGITLKTSPNNMVYLNKISSNTVNPADTNVAGVYVQNSGSVIVQCNYTTYIPRHFVFHGSCLSSRFVGNTMTNGVAGLVYRLLGQIGTQGTQAQPSDNQWFGAFSKGHTHMVSSEVIPNSAYSKTLYPKPCLHT